MFGSIFYHNLIRKYVTNFGNMFNDITIRKFDAGNNAVQSIPVPLTYASKQKYIQILNKRPDGENNTRQIAVALPRLSFNITSMSFDPTRKISPTQKRWGPGTNRRKGMFVETPYKIDFELTAYTKGYDDACQIFEQIVPYFKPDYTNQLILIPELDDQGKFDIRTEMTGNSIQDEYEGAFEETRYVVWTYNFTMDVFFFGPTSDQGVIKRVQTDFIPYSGDDYTQFGRQSRIVITPGLTADGEATTDPNETIPYQQIEAEDPYGFITQQTDYDDGLKYNPRTGKDE